MDYDAYVPDSSRALKSAKAYRMLGHDYATYYQYAIYVRVPLSPPLHTAHPVDAWPSDNISPREGQLCGFFLFFFFCGGRGCDGCDAADGGIERRPGGRDPRWTRHASIGDWAKRRAPRERDARGANRRLSTRLDSTRACVAWRC